MALTGWTNSTSAPLTESPLSFSGIFFPKRTKNDVFVKMDQKGRVID